MPHYTEQQISAANQLDIAAFLLSRGERLKRQGREYLWERCQVWLNGNEWFSHYDNMGGHTVSFIMKYYDMDFQSAMSELLGESAIPYVPPKSKESEPKPFALPPRNQTMNQVYAYLMTHRFIDREIISYFAHERTLYEDANHHNAVFVGLDENGVPRHCHMRGTSIGDNFKLTVSWSDAKHSFHHIGNDDRLYVFEAPIDMMAYLTLNNSDWQKHSYVALCCVAEHAMLHQLKANPILRNVFLCLDNDAAGAKATERLKETLSVNGYSDISILKSKNKDWDEDLKQINGAEAIKASVPVLSDDIVKLCRMYVTEAKYTRKPALLQAKIDEAYTGLRTAYDITKQTEKLLLLLLLAAKEECRKCLQLNGWETIEQKLIAICADKKDVLSLERDMKSYREFYGSKSCEINADLFLEPILKVCADCIYNLEKK